MAQSYFSHSTIGSHFPRKTFTIKFQKVTRWRPHTEYMILLPWQHCLSASSNSILCTPPLDLIEFITNLLLFIQVSKYWFRDLITVMLSSHFKSTLKVQKRGNENGGSVWWVKIADALNIHSKMYYWPFLIRKDYHYTRFSPYSLQW